MPASAAVQSIPKETLLDLFPNPASGKINFKPTHSGKLTVYSNEGKIVLSELPKQRQKSIDVSAWQKEFMKYCWFLHPWEAKPDLSSTNPLRLCARFFSRKAAKDVKQFLLQDHYRISLLIRMAVDFDKLIYSCREPMLKNKSVYRKLLPSAVVYPAFPAWILAAMMILFSHCIVSSSSGFNQNIYINFKDKVINKWLW